MKNKRVWLTMILAAIMLAVLVGCGTKNGIITEDGKTLCYADGELVKGKFVEAEHDADATRYAIWYFSKETGEGSKFIVGKVNEHITAIVEPASPIIYVIEGDDRALVVDAGTGVGDIDELIKLVTDKPYVMWLTHGHIDHIGGAYSADCDVYMNDLDLEIEHFATEETRLNYAHKRGAKKLSNADMAPSKTVSFQPLETGNTIDLGGYTVEALFLGGHTAGHQAFLCVEDRILISGDSANQGVSLTSNGSISVEEYLENLKAIKKQEDRWDKLLISHTSYNLNNKQLIDELITLCQEIVDNGGCSEEKCVDASTGEYETEKQDSNVQISYFKSKINK